MLLPIYGIGIERSDDSLVAVLVRRAWGRTDVVDRLVIPDLSGLPLGECQKLYGDFLCKHGLKAPWTVVSLPRRDIVIRELLIPDTVAEDIQAIVSLQVETMHPYAGDEIVWDSCARKMASGPNVTTLFAAKGKPEQISIAVGIALQQKVHELVKWYEARGIPISQFAVSPLLLTSIGMRKGSGFKAGPTVVINGSDQDIEICGIGTGEAVALQSSFLEFDADSPAADRVSKIVREVENVFSQFRVAPGESAQILLGRTYCDTALMREALENTLTGRCEIKELEADCLATSAGLVAVAASQLRGLNLLPLERRQYMQPVPMMPTYILIAAILLLCIGLGISDTIRAWRYDLQLEAEIAKVELQVQKIEEGRKRSGTQYEKALYLTGIRESSQVPADALEELTQLLPNEAWLENIQMEGNTVTLSGSARSASGVLEAISTALRLESPQFISAISRNNEGIESFRIGARLRYAMK